MEFYYPQSKAIFKEIKKARHILLNVHRNPDLDSVGSALTLYQIIKKLGKTADIVSPHSIGEEFFFLKDSRKIQAIDFSRFDFSPFDLFIILDSSKADVVTISPKIDLPKIPTIIIDHHKTNKLKGKIRLVDKNAAATGEVIYRLLLDWGMVIDKEIATYLFSAIAGDTVFFKYTTDNKKTYNIVNELIKKGANKDALVRNMFNNYNLPSIKLLGLFLQKMEIDKEGGFVWSVITHEEYQRFGQPKGIREMAADMFFQSVKGVEFGMAMLEEKEEKLSISFRSKGGVDVSVLAEKLGGGGHQKAAGCTLYGKFEQMVKRVIKTAQKVSTVK